MRKITNTLLRDETDSMSSNDIFTGFTFLGVHLRTIKAKTAFFHQRWNQCHRSSNETDDFIWIIE